MIWPAGKSYAARFCVDDLVPEEISLSRCRAVFIGESPHRDEVAPESSKERSPFRGVAGREWWSELVRVLGQPIPTRPVPSRETLLRICADLKIAVMNAVQFPIDPKITLHQGVEVLPREALGFEKGTGEWGYKEVLKKGGRSNSVQAAIDDLARRLSFFEDSPAQVVCLGNDSRWFVERALAKLSPEANLKVLPLVTIPHPSAWWRNVAYKKRAVDFLEGNLGSSRNELKRRSDISSDRLSKKLVS